VDSNLASNLSVGIQRKHAETQANMCKPHRSKGLQVTPNTREVCCGPTGVKVKDVSCSPIKKLKLLDDCGTEGSLHSSDEETDVSDHSSDIWLPDSDKLSKERASCQTIRCIENTRKLNAQYPMLYMGIPADCLGVVELLAEVIKYKGEVLTSQDVVSLILNKIRLGDSNKRLSHNYNISESYVSRLFNKYVPYISQCMRSLIMWQPIESVYLNLPLAFWARYYDVYCVIDTFEIQCEHPSNAYDQACSYSDYKSCNTYKYLIGIAPDGTIMFLSKGFLGRFSDIKIAVDSNFIKEIPHGCSVLADRGFKGIDTYLQERNCKLIRPPSTQGSEKYSKHEAIAGRVIASLRIHVERLIHRLREFDMLKPHAVVSHCYSNLIDDIVNIAAGLVNLQSSLIK
jgi:hypothetical protein